MREAIASLVLTTDATPTLHATGPLGYPYRGAIACEQQVQCEGRRAVSGTPGKDPDRCATFRFVGACTVPQPRVVHTEANFLSASGPARRFPVELEIRKVDSSRRGESVVVAYAQRRDTATPPLWNMAVVVMSTSRPCAAPPG